MRRYNLGMEFWIHFLVVGAIVNKRNLRKCLKLAQKYHVDGIEFPWEPLMAINAETLANSLNEFGIKRIALCCFFGDIDPLDGGKGTVKAFASFERMVQFANDLICRDIIVQAITGPWAYKIGKRYFGPRKQDRLKSFLLKVCREICEPNGLTFCLECLRREENGILWGSIEASEVIRLINHPLLKLHLDTFHMNCWGESIVGTLKEVGDDLGWLHVSDRKRHTPGFLPNNESIPWEILAKALEECPNVNEVCFEGFSPAFRKLVPAIGGEFPKDLSPERAIALARRTMEKNAVIRTKKPRL